MLYGTCRVVLFEVFVSTIQEVEEFYQAVIHNHSEKGNTLLAGGFDPDCVLEVWWHIIFSVTVSHSASNCVLDTSARRKTAKSPNVICIPYKTTKFNFHQYWLCY